MTETETPSIHRKTGHRPLIAILADNKSHPLRRARLLAARRYPRHSVPRRAILGGFWDGGRIVQGYTP